MDAAFMKEMQRICAEELARCVRKLETKLTEKQASWTLDVEKSLATLNREIVAVRDEAQEIIEAMREHQENAVQGIQDRLGAVEVEMVHVQFKLNEYSQEQSHVHQQLQDSRSHVELMSGDRELKTAEGVHEQQRQPVDENDCSARESSTFESASPCLPVIDETQSTEELTTIHQKLVSGEKMDVTGFEGMNAAAFVLQYCRFHRGEQGIVDSLSGEIMKYAQLYNCVQRVSSGLKERGFRAGNVMRVCGQSVSSSQLLVLTFSVWNLLGIVELEDGMIDDVGLGDLSGVDTNSTSQNPTRSVGTWLICDSVRHMQRQLSQIDWKPERVIIVAQTGGGGESKSSSYILYNEVRATQSLHPVPFCRVASDAVALQIHHSRHDHGKATSKFTHFQIIESVERSLSSLSTELLERSGGQQSFILNALPFNHSACLILGFLPAIVLGVSLLPTGLLTNRASDQNLTKHFANHQISTVIISPEDLVQLSECRALRNLQTRALQSVLCVGAPTPTLPRSLKCLAAWKPDLFCRRILSTGAFLGGIFTTADLLAPIRQKSQSLYQELGQPLPNIHCNVKKPPSAQQESDMYELTVDMPFGLFPESPVGSGIFVTVSWEIEEANSPQLNVIAVKRESDIDAKGGKKSFVYPVLPIEELIASHPLVSDVAILEWMAEDDDGAIQAFATRGEEGSEPKSDSSLIVFVSLTIGARKYCEDSLATIKNFVAKKLSSDYEIHFHAFLLVNQIFRDVYGRAIAETLERRLAEEDQEEQET